jgi:glycosyltransferase involved in cell wall biosynthesis
LPKTNFSVDLFGVTSGATSSFTHSAAFARALNELLEVRFRTAQKKLPEGLSTADKAMYSRGQTHPQADFGVVVIGQPTQPVRSARWIVWETTQLPAHQREVCDSVAFLWAPSEWGRQMLINNGIDSSRVALVPLGVDCGFFQPEPPTTRSRFRFLMVGKWEIRKFSEGLLHAFATEFGENEDVELFLHAHNPYLPGFSLAEEVERTGVANTANIVLGSACSQADLRALYQSADCFVLPTRAEGWGLPILESMACGVPAIVTRYSAPLDYVTEDNGYLLDVARMVDARDSLYGIDGGQWAEPDIGHLRFLMRHVFEHRDEVREKGRCARRDAQRFTWKNSAEVAVAAIERHMGSTRDWPPNTG